MSQIKSFEERIKDIERIEIMLAGIKDRLFTVKEYEERELKEGIILPNDIRVRITTMLTGLGVYAATTIPAALTLTSGYAEVWQVKLSKAIFHDPQTWESVAVVVVSGTDATLTINQTDTVDIFGTGGTQFFAADVIEISNAENPKHNGRHTIKTAGVAEQVLTLDANMLGEDNANDESMIITLVER